MITSAHAHKIRQALTLYRERGEWDGTLGSARSCLAQAQYVWDQDLAAFVRGLIAARTLTVQKRALLDHFADGHAGSCWDFGAGTVSWAKKNMLIVEVSWTPTKYQITDAGRVALAENETKDGAR